jgi:hypothetical protein
MHRARCAKQNRVVGVRSGVIRVVLAVGRELPVFPDERTSPVSVGMSQTHPEAT